MTATKGDLKQDWRWILYVYLLAHHVMLCALLTRIPFPNKHIQMQWCKNKSCSLIPDALGQMFVRNGEETGGGSNVCMLLA